jgi:hypothetical protein
MLPESANGYLFNGHGAEVEVVEEVGFKGWGYLGVFSGVKVIIHCRGL